MSNNTLQNENSCGFFGMKRQFAGSETKRNFTLELFELLTLSTYCSL
jgi:hypothetical protein